MSVLKAAYFDGKTSRRHAVSLFVSAGRLKVVGRDVSEQFDARRVRRSLRVANTPRWLYLPGGGACVTEDNDAVDRMTRVRRYERILHRWESRPAYAAAAIALVAAAVWLLVARVVPAAVEHVAERIPVETESVLGRETLSSMDEHIFKPSTLSKTRQASLGKKLAAMASAAGETARYRLEFRASPVIGANALALPSGIIVMTDELVGKAKNDQEVLGVLAHELGHVRYRHTMRRLLESSATALIIAAVTGDVASATSLAAAAPTVLLQLKYSRDSEREADRYAIDAMRKAGYDPRHLTALLGRIEPPRRVRRFVPGFLSSHPSTEEREVLARSGAADPVPAEDAAPQAAAEILRPPAEGLVPDKPKRAAVDPVHRQIVTLLEQRKFDELDRLLGALQGAFEGDAAGGSVTLEQAYFAFDRVPRTAEAALDDWVRVQPASYAARTARGCFHYFQGLDARGTAFIAKTPEANIRTMRFYLGKSQADLEGSLALTPKPYVSRLTLMSIARVSGSRDDEQEHYAEALKLAPQSVELRLAHMTSLEPRWGGSYREMEALVKEGRAQLKDAAAADRLAARVPAYRGNELQRKDDLEGALGRYNEAIALYQGAGTLCERAYVLGKLKRDPEAFADVKLALSKVRDHHYCLSQAVPLASRAQDAAEAIAMLTLVIEADARSAHAFNQRGWRFQQAGNVELAYQDYLASARLGDGWGQLMTGKMQWAGLGTPANREEALEWLRKAAAQGHPDAKLSLKQALEQVEKR
ncbi:MAG: M48 family metalloprotease [Betaproteobacteria bacterium]|nr:M48 family metalloprotease [Betaproteobacteria bacterium]